MKKKEFFFVKGETSGVSNLTGDKKRHMPSFWLPSCGPQAKKTKVEKPDKTVYCPMSRKPIKVAFL